MQTPNYTLFDKPVTKTIDEMQKGDIFDTQYGDYNNIVRIVFDHTEQKKENNTVWIKTVGTYLKDNAPFEGWDWISKNRKKSYEVIGHIN